jgi:hypothetical protein
MFMDSVAAVMENMEKWVQKYRAIIYCYMLCASQKRVGLQLVVEDIQNPMLTYRDIFDDVTS